MRESFLHFIWQFQKFNTLDLTTADGQPIQVFSIGTYNNHAGPDFLNAKVSIDDITWYGHVELHLKSSDWNQHKHQNDDAYNNVILHVVWENDKEVKRANGEEVCVVELKNRIDQKLLYKCNQLLKSTDKIPCQSKIHAVRKIDVISMMEQAGVFRLEQKSEVILDMLESNKGSWEETAYQLLAKNFGFKTNSDSMLKWSRLLPHKILVKHMGNPLQLEAMVYGMAGLLPTHSDHEYVVLLIKEFDFLSKKYGLINQNLIKVEWKFLRMRPGNFPTVRFSQLAAFMVNNDKFFNSFIHFNTSKELIEMFRHLPSDYWKDHYDFHKTGSRKNLGIGDASIEVLLINTVAPLLAAYAIRTGNNHYMEKAIDLLQSLKSENNHIVDDWKKLGLDSKNAFDSQALISIRNDFCLKNKCLSCKIGVNLVNR